MICKKIFEISLDKHEISCKISPKLIFHLLRDKRGEPKPRGRQQVTDMVGEKEEG